MRSKSEITTFMAALFSVVNPIAKGTIAGGFKALLPGLSESRNDHNPNTTTKNNDGESLPGS